MTNHHWLLHLICEWRQRQRGEKLNDSVDVDYLLRSEISRILIEEKDDDLRKSLCEEVVRLMGYQKKKHPEAIEYATLLDKKIGLPPIVSPDQNELQL